MNTLKYASKLDPQFVARVSKLPVPWGPLGYTVFKRTYARLREDLGRTEEWGETVTRCLNAVLQYGGQYTKEEIERLFLYIYNLKCTPPGRMLWQLGTSTVERVGGDSLNNCWFVCPNELDAFCFAFDELMLGGGVGFSVMPGDVYKLPEIKGPLSITRRDGNDVDFIVPDNREGWVELLRRTLQAFFVTGRSFTYSTHCVRGKGERIKGFGGVASGPGELVKGIAQITAICNNRANSQLQPIDVLDIMNIIGSVVVSGNVRRSAMIALGSAKDLDYLTAKQWSKGIPNWRAMSNNSVIRSTIDRLPDEFWSGYRGEGEPYGLVNMDLARKKGRLRDPDGYRPDSKARGTNPCLSVRTLVLTRQGYVPIGELVGKLVEVWNGEQWSQVTPRETGQNQKMVKVSLSDGTELTTTEYHEWLLDASTRNHKVEVRVEAKDLKVGDKLSRYEMPVMRDGREFPHAYSHGFFCGDGHTVDGQARAYLYGKKQSLVSAVEGRHPREDVEQNRTHVFLPEGMPPKGEVPHWADLDGRLEWLAGLLDADGCTVQNPNSVCLHISSVDLNFLREVRLMLTTMGVSAKIGVMHEPTKRMMPDGKGGVKEYQCQKSYRLQMGATDAFNLLNLGLRCRRLVVPSTKPQRRAKRFVRVTAVEDAGVEAKVYCFNEPLAHRGTFEGTVLGQCAEVTLEPYECCDLAELFVPRLDSTAEFADAAILMYRVCKTVLQQKFSWRQTEEVIRRNQRIGVSVSGVCESAYGPDDYDLVYRALEEEDRRYSGEIGANRSIKLTCTKPSGSVSLLPGVTPGVHPAYSRHYIRRVRFAGNDPIVEACRRNGYPVEPQIGFDGTPDYDTQIVSFPVYAGPKTKIAADVSAIDQLELQRMIQTNWADNSVSVTVYYRDHELDDIKAWLKEHYRDEVKTVSFLRHSDHGFQQAPLESISQQQYDDLSKRVKPLTSLSEAQQWDIVESLECAGGACPVK